MPRFNIALLPVDQALQGVLQKLARRYFSDIQDEYILASDALAHITLSQFYARDDHEALELFNAYNDAETIGLTVKQFHLRVGTGPHAGKFWAELLIEPTAELLERQQKCVENLVKHAIEPLTPINTYSPHITLARLATKAAALPEHDEIPRGLRLFQPIVGGSTENGALINILSNANSS